MSESDRLELHQNRLRLQEVTAALESDKGNEELLDLKQKLEEVIELTTSLLGEDDVQTWKQGDHCMAMCSSDMLFYRAEIIEKLGNDKVAVKFIDYNQMDVCEPVTVNQKKGVSSKKKTEDRMKKIEKKKTKKMRLEEKNTQLEKMCEKEKNKWLTFNKKMSKQLKAKKSIFASPETIDGRVGVGTCGTGGRPMTKYSVNTSYLRK